MPVLLCRAAARADWEEVDRLIAGGADWNEAPMPNGWLPLHWILDWHYCANPEDTVQQILRRGADPDHPSGPLGETALHVAVRRRRLAILDTLLEAGADIEAVTTGGMTPYRHALRRNFPDVARQLAERGADTSLTRSDELAVALLEGRLDEAAARLEKRPALAMPGNPEEARLVADLAASGRIKALELLLEAGADIAPRGLDGGTPLHQAAWFGQPGAAALLIERGAPLDVRGDDHDCTPLGWVAHGSRHSDGAGERAEAYVEIARLLLEAGAPLPGPEDTHDRDQFAEAAAGVQAVLAEHGWPRSAD